MKNIFYFFVFLMIFGYSCKSKKVQELPPEQFSTNINGEGPALEIRLEKGEEHNHPLLAIWVEDMDGNYIQTLYVTRSIATGIFGHGDDSRGVWEPGEIRRPATVPVWAHKRGVQANDGLYIPDHDTHVPDAYSGATPWGNFILNTRLDNAIDGKFRLRLEINQTWDWNEYWTNNKYPDNEEYKTSCQPALVYEAVVDPSVSGSEFEMKLIGHSHYAGENGEIYPDLSTFTTALDIVREIVVVVR